jgi:hypothetical protein
MEYLKYRNRSIQHWLAFPFIWACLIPLLLTDIFMELYHHFCFPLYDLPLVKRGDYIKFDRAKLSYLNPAQKIYCVYCSYANGFLRYAAEIAAETERYWCGIKHESASENKAFAYQKDFIEHGDEKAFKKFKEGGEISGERNRESVLADDK